MSAKALYRPRRSPRYTVATSMVPMIFSIPDDPLRSVPVHGVAGLGVDLQGGTGNRCREPFLFSSREEGILLPPQDQRQHIDLTKREHVIVVDRKHRPLQIVAPYSGRELEAL